MLAIATQHNVDDVWHDLDRWCRDISPLWNNSDPRPARLDLTECKYLGPSAASLIYATWLMRKQRSSTVDIELPHGPEGLRAFCTFSNLRHYLHREKQADPRHPRSETVPLSQFFDDASQQSYRVLQLVKRHHRLSKDEEIQLSSAVHEVCQNIHDHAESPIGGISCSRFFSKSREVRVAVVDSGQTISGSLGKAAKYAGTSDTDALELVCQGKHTSRSRRHNMGLGISNLIAVVRALTGRVAIVSGQAAAVLEATHVAAGSGLEPPAIKTLDWRFPGTGVFFTLVVTNDLPD